MRRLAVFVYACACACALDVPAHAALTPQVAAAEPSPTPSPTALVTPPPPFPGVVASLPPVPESMDTAPGAAESPAPTRAASPTPTPSPVRVLIHAFPLPPKSAHQPKSTATPSPIPAASPSASPVPTAPPSQEPTVEVTVGPGSVRFETLPPTVLPAHPAGSGKHRRGRVQAMPSASPSASAAPAPPRIETPGPTPTPTPTASPSPAPTVPKHGVTPALLTTHENDRAYDLVGGKWTCRTFAGTPIEHEFLRAEDAVSLEVATTVQVDKRKVTLHETYRLHSSSGRWSVSLASGQFIATAGPWNARTWTFSGIDTENGRAFDATMTYKRASVDEFTRTFARNEDGVMRMYSGEHCLRVSY